MSSCAGVSRVKQLRDTSRALYRYVCVCVGGGSGGWVNTHKRMIKE
jgi:hypothetical protein